MIGFSLLWCCLLVACSILAADNEVEKFYQTVKHLRVVSDKIRKHSYQEIYGNFLLPFIEKKKMSNKPIRFFEIGLGCRGVNKFFGGSVEIWNSFFSPSDILWAADLERHGDCIEKAKAEGKLHNFQTVVGDQSNTTTLHSWMNITGGNFDVIVDDGGHRNHQIYTSIHTLWSSVAPGGLYFIEDLQVGRNKPYNTTDYAMSDVIRDWIEQLLITPEYQIYKHKILPGIKSIYCQYEACVIMKCKVNDLARCNW